MSKARWLGRNSKHHDNPVITASVVLKANRYHTTVPTVIPHIQEYIANTRTPKTRDCPSVFNLLLASFRYRIPSY
jgi:hypothetical protein